MNVKYRKVLGIGIGFFGDSDTFKLYLILCLLGICFVPPLITAEVVPSNKYIRKKNS